MTVGFKRRLIAFVTFIGGFYFFLVYFLPIPEGATVFHTPFDKFHEKMILAVQVIGVMAIGLGVINIIQVHGGRIIARRKGLTNSLALLLGLIVAMFVEAKDLVLSERATHAWKQFVVLSQFVGSIEKSSSTAPERDSRIALLIADLERLQSETQLPSGLLSIQSEAAFGNPYSVAFKNSLARSSELAVQYKSTENSGTSPTQNTSQQLVESLKATAASAQKVVTLNAQSVLWKKLSRLIQEGFFVPLGASMFALLAFYIAGAAYRSFRVKSWEAAIMMVAALVVILGQIPQGVEYLSEDLPLLRKWLLDNISTPAFRAISFGAAVAGLAMAVRMWLSLERSPLEAGDDAESGRVDLGRA